MSGSTARRAHVGRGGGIHWLTHKVPAQRGQPNKCTLQALIHLKPEEMLVGEALHDKLRIQNSALEDRDELIRHLGTAASALGPSASRLFHLETQTSTPVTVDNARSILAKVRRGVNEFRDARRTGLVQARNNLVKAVVFTGTTTFVLLGLALIGNANKEAIVATAAFYLVGAVVGLFKQLGVASSIDSVKEPDYGLSTARLIHGPLYSGIAAVGGVVLIALAGELNTTGKEAIGSIPSLSAIFDLAENPLGLVWSAVFGLAPNLLTDRLGRQAEDYKSELKSSKVGE